jgi:GAF domain-containing protein
MTGTTRPVLAYRRPPGGEPGAYHHRAGRVAGRWPEFSRQALAAGFLSVHAFPMRVRHEVIGALNVFGSTVGGNFDDADVQIVQALTDVATIALLQERAVRRGELLTEQFQSALNSRIVIEQAKGGGRAGARPLHRRGLHLLRDFARRNNRKLTEVATEVLSDPAALGGLAG